MEDCANVSVVWAAVRQPITFLLVYIYKGGVIQLGDDWKPRQPTDSSYDKEQRFNDFLDEHPWETIK
ncbi:hypothetical protein BDM02DRAFT_1904341 [Thelephora ganbajun]|uniref:Uncharacterized protein n=1 Tax=Thelephora ganbajun TaxID=370292 RepID=A0ACB6ZUP9_THEGA|nr:hypothetical protein BDM02DRAFT_1904341 [Thelephora ganbajun]